MENKYQPISCSIYDQLEYAAMRRHKLEISYKVDQEVETITETVINLESKNKVEYLITENISIRLDHIVSFKKVHP